jgi:hypothetical protein
VLSIKWSRIIGEEETCRVTSKDKRRRDSLMKRFIKSKRPLNPTHISPKKEK